MQREHEGPFQIVEDRAEESCAPKCNLSVMEETTEIENIHDDVYNFDEISTDNEPIKPFQRNKILNKLISNVNCETSDEKIPEVIKDNKEDDSNNGSSTKSSNYTKFQKIVEKREYYNVDVGKSIVVSEPLSNGKNFVNCKLVENIMENLLINRQCYCPFELISQSCKYSSNLTVYGRCLHSDHNAKYMIDITEVDTNIFKFDCYSSANGHPECQKNVREPVSINNYRFEIFNNVYFKNSPQSQSQLTDLEDLGQLWFQSCNDPDSFLRYFSLPLMVVMYTKEQLRVVDQSRTPIIIHLDATGAHVRPINGLKETHFYYAD
ncbi:hypothetical protein KQX54_013167 [Cotesia glomerata]|uniref:Uncharacterized protein n=1 Tax=Cotesia glomerata TaxID=32391 RepID=A0AAV7IJG5_COTGL|nr:hypothetical protein KQX54_013167 [Cotesia glomerata]